MKKDRTYFQHLAEAFYMSHFAEIKERVDKKNAERADRRKAREKRLKEKGGTARVRVRRHEEDYQEYILVDTKDESCFFEFHYWIGLAPHQILFSCSMKDGQVQSKFDRDGTDNMAKALGLVDIYDRVKRIEIPWERKEDGALHVSLPEEYRGYDKDFFKIKLYGLDNFVAECNYTGWGDCFTNSVLEVIADIMSRQPLNFSTYEMDHGMLAYVGPGDDEGTNYYADFEFSHCEVAMDDDGETAWAIYLCYNYFGLEDWPDEE